MNTKNLIKVNDFLSKIELNKIFDSETINNLLLSFENVDFEIILADFDSTLRFIFNALPRNESYFIPLYEAISYSFKNSNIIKIEFSVNIEKDNNLQKLLLQTLKNNFKFYEFEIEDSNTIKVDFHYNFHDFIDAEIIKRELNLLGATNKINLNFIHYNEKVKLTQFQLEAEEKQKQNNKSFVREASKNMPLSRQLNELPLNEEELASFENPHVIVEGSIFNIEERELKKNFLYLVDITNFKESVTLKIFSKEKLNFAKEDVISVQGVLAYDDFSKMILLNVTNPTTIKKLNGVHFLTDLNFDFVKDKRVSKRTELSCFSTFSTQDGLSSVDDYLKTAEDFGVKALAITDLENVQAYPDLFNKAPNYNIKPIFGVTMNVVDKDQYKIFYKRNSKNNNIIGIDIETTGFSNIFDDIIEISAYKINSNGEKEEYSCLVKPTDFNKLTNKIITLTNITPDMLLKEGIDIKDALKGLLDFVNDGIIVAHNATFDVFFLEQKIKHFLGIEKHFSFIDTLNFSRAVLPPMKSFTLDKVCSKLKVELTSHHRAIYDAIACLNIYYSLMNSILNVKDFNIENISDDELIFYEFKMIGKTKTIKFEQFLNENKIKYTSENLSETEGRVNNYYKLQINKNNFEILNNKLTELKVKILEQYIKKDNLFDDLNKLNTLIKNSDYIDYARPSAVTLLVRNQKGLKILYKLISKANIFGIAPHGNIIFKEDLTSLELKENILIGSSNILGLFPKVYNNGFDEWTKEWFKLYDYIEISPLKTYLSITDRDEPQNIKQAILNIIEEANNSKKIIVADCHAHYISKNLKVYRDVFANTLQVGGVGHYLRGKKETGLNVMLATDDFINILKNDYNFTSDETKKYIIKNPDKISDLIDDKIKVIPDKLYAPTDDFLRNKVLDIVGHKVPSVLEEFKKIVYDAAKKYEIDGILPEYISKRLDKEMNSIIGHGFYIIYYIAYLLVKKSNSDGYVVGSRGSVGSSLVAYLMGITEVNALKPHYICPNCHYQIYKDEKEIVAANDKQLKNNLNSVLDGFDLPPAVCPICGKPLIADGHDIPFETFLGFNGDKTPDIDLNFSGDYQPTAHNFCKEVFGEEHAFRAGTIGTVAEKTAIDYLNKYNENNNIRISPTETKRRSVFLTDVKRTTGQHPGGIILIPENMEIYDFTPIQYPANKKQDWFTTHLDYNAIHENVLKMDILGHDDPTILKFLMENVKANPSNYPFSTPQEIPINDPEIIKYLRKNSKGEVESLGIPELGTNFVKGMLVKIQPKSFYELIKVSGLSHGTNVWEKNAETLVEGSSQYGLIPFKNTIGCRDDIMVQLLANGLEPKMAFDIMEFVRKGKVAKDPEKWEIFRAEMIKKNVPEWYIWSLAQIKYMFPKAHAVAYVMSAMRIAWFKAHRPLDFYQAFFTIRADVFDAKTISTNNIEYITDKMNSINSNKAATKVEKDSAAYLEVAIEMLKRGLTFAKPDINSSDKKSFLKINDKTLLMPFSVLDGVGEITASNVYENRGEKPYSSIDDLKNRGKADKKMIESLKELNALNFN